MADTGVSKQSASWWTYYCLQCGYLTDEPMTFEVAGQSVAAHKERTGHQIISRRPF